MHVNLTAYDGYEDMSNYKTPEALEAYRSMLLKRTEKQRDFIKNLFGGSGINVFEACSGNSRLLYSLSLAGLLEMAIGVEISETRHNFAQLWKADLGIHNVHNECADVTYFAEPPNSWLDLVVCLSNAFLYFEPIHKKAPRWFLEVASKGLVHDGKLLLEIRDYHREIEFCKKWGRFGNSIEFEDGDPFFKMEQMYSYDSKKKFLTVSNYFARRDGFTSDNTEVFRIYTDEEIRQLLNKCGFKDIQIYPDWVDPPEVFDRMVIVSGR